MNTIEKYESLKLYIKTNQKNNQNRNEQKNKDNEFEKILKEAIEKEKKIRR